MKIVTIHFTGGLPLVLEVPADAVGSMLDALAADPSGNTRITGDNGTTYLINRKHLTHVDAA